MKAGESEVGDAGPEFFRKHGYAVASPAISAADAERYAAYALMKRQHPDYYEKDSRLPALFRYADVLGESLLRNLQARIEALTGLALLPCFSKLGIYSAPASVEPHTEGPAREISGVLALGGSAPGRWPCWFKGASGDQSIELAPRCLLVYRGPQLEHWRTPLHAETWVELALHYVIADGDFKHHRFDGRHGLGEPQDRKQQDQFITLRRDFDAALAAGDDRPCFCKSGQRYSACHGLMYQALTA